MTFAVPDDTQPASSSFCEEYVQIGDDSEGTIVNDSSTEVESADEEIAPPPSKRPDRV